MPDLKNSVVLLGLLLAVALAGLGCSREGTRGTADKPLKLSLALGPVIYSGLIAIADEEGFFRESGLEVTIKEYPSGLAALEAMLRGESEAATVADFALSGKMSEEPSLRIVASIGSTDTGEILARKDRGINAPTDLEGKRIGVSQGTTGEYYLTQFLQLNRVPLSKVTLVDVPPGRIAGVLAEGEVDAVATWEAPAYEAWRLLDGSVVSWPSQNTQDYFWLLAVKLGKEDSQEIERLLAALHKAEEFAIQHGDKARAIVMRRWGFDETFMRRYWSKVRLGLSLDQALVVNLEDARNWWLKLQPGQTGESSDVTRFFHTAPLDRIDPRAVTIFR